MPDDDPPEHLQELRRGTVVMATLATLSQPRYGYALLVQLDSAGFAVEGNTEEARPRKFYVRTDDGTALLTALLDEWQGLHASVEELRPVIWLANQDMLLNAALVTYVQEHWSGFHAGRAHTVILVSAVAAWAFDTYDGWSKALRH